jgi:hypothetical protein
MGRGEESIAMEVFSKGNRHAGKSLEECQRFEFKEKQVNQRDVVLHTEELV